LKTQPISAARIEFAADGVLRAPDFDDVYHPRIGALAQARHVFLGGNGLPGRWAARERFVVLETGFGLGNNFIATWHAWQQDAQRCRQLVYVSIERHPPTLADLARVHADSPLPALAAALLAAWPPATPDLHVLDFEGGRVRLLLALGDVAAWLPELSLQADAFYLDGFAPARNPAMWDRRVLKAVGRLAAPGATAATWSVARDLREGLTSAGFEVSLRPGIGGKRETTQALFAPRYAPRHAQRQAIATPAPTGRTAIVVGAGLAGAAVAQALAAEGWSVDVLDRRATPAAETSGNAAGLFHGTVHGEDGPHARLLRAAALHAERTLRPLIAAGLPGQLQGLLRLDTRPQAALQALIDRQQLPAAYVQALDAATASAHAGVTLPGSAWFYAGGGWVAPTALVGHWLQAPGVRFRGGCDVHTLEATALGWCLRDATGRAIAEAAVVVLANAADAMRLLGAAWPLRRLRGQVSGWDGPGTALKLPTLPIAGDGYALPLAGGGLLCGATSEESDDSHLRLADHRQNFERLQRLTGLLPPADASRWRGRVGWRVQADDKQPVAGAVPLARLPEGWRGDQVRLWPRCAGLYVCTALGGRGITWAPLLGRLLAAQIAGAPLPLQQSGVEAIDPARWQVRAARRAASV
jgi:tRNA 5-methylaminomethyl-2-thiouridine biosynthesis bifunctional protein